MNKEKLEGKLDELRGKAEEGAGRAKEAIGSAVAAGGERAEEKGAVDQVKGAVRETVGEAEQDVGNAEDEAKHAFKAAGEEEESRKTGSSQPRRWRAGSSCLNVASDAIAGTGERQGRRILAALARRACWRRKARAPLHLVFSAKLAQRWMPGLFPERPSA